MEIRYEKMRIAELHQRNLDKKGIMNAILERNRLASREVAYIGDDLGDLEVIKSVGFAAAVADAHSEIKKHSHFICQNPGGKGAVREFIEFILSTQKKWETIQANVKNLAQKKT